MDPAQANQTKIDDGFLQGKDTTARVQSQPREINYSEILEVKDYATPRFDSDACLQGPQPMDAEKQKEMEEERALMICLAQGDTSVFWNLWDRHRRHLYSVCLMQMRGVHADAEDALSRVMLKACDKLPQYAATIINLRAWLTRMTYNLCVEIHRESKRRIRVVDNIQDLRIISIQDIARLQHSPEQTLIYNEMHGYLMHAVDELPSPLREPLVLRFKHEMACRDIAKRLRLTTDNVRKRIQRARAILQAQWNKYLSGLAVGAQNRRIPAPPLTGQRLNNVQADSAIKQKGEELEFNVQKICVVQVTLPSGIEVNFPIFLDQKPVRQQLKIETLRKYVNRHPRGWKKRLDLAYLLYVSGLWQEAIEQYRSAVEKHPQSITAWLQLGTILHLIEKDQEAIGAYECALDLASSAPARHHIAGLIEVCRQKYEAATIELERAATMEPNRAIHWRTLGLLHMRRENPVQALGAFDRALVASGDDVIALTFSYDALVALGQLEEAQRRVTRALSTDRENVPALKRLADHRSGMGLVYGAEGKKTRLLIRKALQIAPDAASAHESLALYHISRGEWREGSKVLSAFARCHPKNPLGWYNSARWLFRTGEPEAAAEAIMSAYFLCQKDENINRAVCKILPHAGRLDDLRPLLEDMPKRFPALWSIWATVGNVFARWFNEGERACSLSSQSPRLQPRLSQAWFEHGRVLALADKHREAIAAIEEGWKWLPKDGGYKQSVPAAAWLGESYRLLGEATKGEDWWKEAALRAQALMTVDPATGYYWQGKALQSLGDSPSALQAYRAALGKHLLHPLRQEVKMTLKLLQPQQ